MMETLQASILLQLVLSNVTPQPASRHMSTSSYFDFSVPQEASGTAYNVFTELRNFVLALVQARIMLIEVVSHRSQLS
ncbi:hypothetical protein EV424DRAFT_460465 [Suillus variegatus]|nr:hypothetical protein EV424DRAFT_460465 [Suillus variegatus]